MLLIYLIDVSRSTSSNMAWYGMRFPTRRNQMGPTNNLFSREMPYGIEAPMALDVVKWCSFIYLFNVTGSTCCNKSTEHCNFFWSLVMEWTCLHCESWTYPGWIPRHISQDRLFVQCGTVLVVYVHWWAQDTGQAVARTKVPAIPSRSTMYTGVP